MSENNRIEYKPIGIIRTPFEKPEGTPIQPSGGAGEEGTIEVFEEYADGLEDIGGFSHLIVLYHFHLAKPYSPKVKPFLENRERGLFATRAPARPNPIGLSVVRLVRVEKNMLRVNEVDIVDGTPLLDIKPFVPDFDMRETVRCGWLEKVKQNARTTRADTRFKKD